MTTPRTVSADEALSVVQSGMTVVAGCLSSEPVVLLEALARRSQQVGSLRLVAGMFLDGYEALAPHLGNSIDFVTWFMPQTLLGDVTLGPRVDFLPLSIVQTFRYLTVLNPDVCLIQVSPPDEGGNYSVGISANTNLLLAQRARTVIVQVNPHMPFTTGPDSLLHESSIDFVVEASRPLRAFPNRAPDDRSRAIAAHVAQLIPDGATIQSGIGTIPEAALRQLLANGRTDLLLISQLTDAGRELIESGCCVADGPAAVVGEVLGSSELYKWVDHNPRVEMRNALGTHSLAALAKRRSFTSINSTLEVDLFGQINSEVVKTGQAGGIGGSLDFMMGSMFEGAQSILALPSTTSRGKSRIVPTITKGLVTAPRSLVQLVVTEYGVADIRSTTVKETAEALLSISHPDHRDGLRATLLRSELI